MMIRRYSPSDRQAVRDIAFDTALMGEPAASLLDDRDAMADILTGYFTDIEPESSFVAVEGGEVAGYLIGSRDAAVVNKKFAARFLPRLLLKLFTTNILFRGNNARSILAYIAGLIKGDFKTPDLGLDYPATLHINVKSGCRGRNIGRGLIAEYLKYLQDNKVRGVYLATMSERASDFFRREGFELLHRGKRTCFRHILKRDVPVFMYGKRLV